MEVQCIWQAIVPWWAFGVVGFAPQVFPYVGILEALYCDAAEYAHEVSGTCWTAKRESFRAQVDESWTSHGVSFSVAS